MHETPKTARNLQLFSSKSLIPDYPFPFPTIVPRCIGIPLARPLQKRVFRLPTFRRGKFFEPGFTASEVNGYGCNDFPRAGILQDDRLSQYLV